MTIQRTQHMVIAIGLFEKMSDKQLEEVFSGPGGAKMKAKDIRQHLGEQRAKGYEYYPCACENHKADGSCLGIEENADVS